jgi:hypothetical protein
MRHQNEYRQIEHRELSRRSFSSSKKHSPIIDLRCQGLDLLNKIWDAPFFFNYLQLPLAASVFYFISFTYLYTHILSIPLGVNYIFASSSWKYLSILSAGSIIILYLINKTRPRSQWKINRSPGRISRGDLLLLLLPLTPVAQYILHNQDILSPVGSLFVVVVFTLFSGLYIFAFPALLGFPGSPRTWISLGLAFTFTITSMPALSLGYSWYESGSLWIQWAVLAGVFLGVWLLSNLNNRHVLRIPISMFFIANSTIQLFSMNDTRARSNVVEPDHKLLALIAERTPVTRPNIYILVYDAYFSSETMLAYGIDNHAQEVYLNQLGFISYPHTYSVENYSLASMSKVLNVSTDSYSNFRRAVSGDGIV